MEKQENKTPMNQGGTAINYGVMSPQVETKVCKGTGLTLPITDFYFDKRNNRYESYCMKYKSNKMNEARKSSEINQLKQNNYNLKYQLKELRKEIKALKANGAK